MNKQFMKKIGLSLGVLLMTGTVIQTPLQESTQVEAAQVTKYKTKANLNLRTKASTSGKSIAVIKKGKEVTYVGKSGSWYKVKYGSKTGYVSSKYLTKTKTVSSIAQPKSPNASQTVYTTTAALNLRSGASTKYKTLTTIPKGKQIKMVSYGKSWSKVSYGSKTGYVSSKYLKKTTKTAPKVQKEEKFGTKKVKAKANTVMYTSTTSTKKRVLTIPKNATLSTNTKLSGFYKVSYKGKTGWASISALPDVKKVAPIVQKAKFLSPKDSQKVLTALHIPNARHKTFRPVQSDIYMSFFVDYGGSNYRPATNWMSVYYAGKKVRTVEVGLYALKNQPEMKSYALTQVQVVSDSVFGKGTKASAELQNLLTNAINKPVSTRKYVTIGGNKTAFIQQPGVIIVDFGDDGSEPEL